MAALPGQQASTAARVFDAALRAGGTACGQSAWGLVRGARADALVLDTTAPALRGIPTTHQLDALVFGSGEPGLCEVIVAGRVAMQDGRHPDQDTIARNFEAAMQEIWRAD